MSECGWLVCHDCQQIVHLGDIVRPGEGKFYFHIHSLENRPNSENKTMTKVVWKFLANHIDHNIQIMTDYNPLFDQVAEYTEIGGDEKDDIVIDDYLDTWKG